MSPTNPVTRDVLPRGLLILLSFAAATVTVAGIKATSGFIAEAFLALVLMITVHPVSTWLVKKGFPRWLAAVATILMVYLILVGLLIALTVSIARLAALAPTYAPEANQLIADLADWLKDLGVEQAQVNAVLDSLDFGRLFGLATSILSGMLDVLSGLLFICLLTLFIGFDAGRFLGELRNAQGERPAVVSALASFAHGTRKYFAVSAAFGLIVAILDTGALWLLGIPAAVVWGVLSFVTNFIPNIGFVIGLIPPALLGLLEGGVGLMLAVIIIYCVINFILQSIIQPKFVGDAIGLSTSLTFMSLVFWAWVLGPLGAILALPATLLAKALFVDVDPEARWVVPLLSGVPNPETAEAAQAVPDPEPSPSPAPPPPTADVSEPAPPDD